MEFLPPSERLLLAVRTTAVGRESSSNRWLLRPKRPYRDVADSGHSMAPFDLKHTRLSGR
jgi:hypothetical protein